MMQFESTHNPEATKEAALAYLARWADELKKAHGPPNMLARILEAPGGSGDGLAIPRGIRLSLRSQETDELIHQIGLLDKTMAKVLVGKALGLSVSDLGRELKCSRAQAHVELENAISAFRMGLHFRHPVRAKTRVD